MQNEENQKLNTEEKEKKIKERAGERKMIKKR